MKKLAYISFLAFILWFCEKDDNSPKFEYVARIPITDTIFDVTADVETEPVEASSGTDAADDPAVWIHPTDPSKSIIYGSNKTGGIVVYNLSGTEIMYAELGRINNIDVAYNLKLQDEEIDVCGGTNRTVNAIDIYKINPETGELDFILDDNVISTVDEVYGFCFYHSPHTGTNYAILCGKNGVIEHYEIEEGKKSSL